MIFSRGNRGPPVSLDTQGRPGCSVSHGEMALLCLPLPGSWLPKPSSHWFQSGWKRWINMLSPSGIQMSSTTNARNQKSSSLSVDEACLIDSR